MYPRLDNMMMTRHRVSVSPCPRARNELLFYNHTRNMAHNAAVAADGDKIISATERAVRQLSATTTADGQHGAVEELALAATESALGVGEKTSFKEEVKYATMGWFQAGASKLSIFNHTM